MSILERFRGVGVDSEGKNACNCTCWTGGKDQSANHQRDNNPTCKCKKPEGREQSNQDTVYDENSDTCLLAKDWF